MKPILLLFASLGSVSAAVLSFTDSATTSIPDGSSSGIVRSLPVSAPGQTITGAEVDISLSGVSVFGSFLGDLYLYLQHDADLAVLMNRAGRRAGTPAGYADDQSLSLTFTMLATNDIHNYRLSVTGAHTTPLASPLTGLWLPDGRAVDPAAVLDTSPITARLDVFNGDAADGTWNLFAADLSTGAVHQINTWTLRLTTIPEPGSAALTLTALMAAGSRRNRNQRR